MGTIQTRHLNAIPAVDLHDQIIFSRIMIRTRYSLTSNKESRSAREELAESPSQSTWEPIHDTQAPINHRTI